MLYKPAGEKHSRPKRLPRRFYAICTSSSTQTWGINDGVTMLQLPPPLLLQPRGQCRLLGSDVLCVLLPSGKETKERPSEADGQGSARHQHRHPSPPSTASPHSQLGATSPAALSPVPFTHPPPRPPRQPQPIASIGLPQVHARATFGNLFLVAREGESYRKIDARWIQFSNSSIYHEPGDGRAGVAHQTHVTGCTPGEGGEPAGSNTLAYQ